MKQLNVRPMQKKDLDLVYSIECRAQQTPWSRSILRDCLLVGYDCRVLELENDTESAVIGFVICRYQHKACHVLNLCIAPQQQKKGYGKHLLQTLLESLKDTWIDLIILEVRPSNKIALALYKRLGFIEVDVKKSYYQDTNGSEDALLMAKKM